jgi:Methyltransferase domain
MTRDDQSRKSGWFLSRGPLLSVTPASTIKEGEITGRTTFNWMVAVRVGREVRIIKQDSRWRVGEVRHTPSAGSQKKLSQFDNTDQATIASFGDEWSRFDQSKLDEKELHRIFSMYFRIFPWHLWPDKAEGFDMGCGSGRWAKQVLPRVGLLNCIDPSTDALSVAKRNLSGYTNVRFLQATTETVSLRAESQDFGYSLRVLHHYLIHSHRWIHVLNY